MKYKFQEYLDRIGVKQNSSKLPPQIKDAIDEFDYAEENDSTNSELQALDEAILDSLEHWYEDDEDLDDEDYTPIETQILKASIDKKKISKKALASILGYEPKDVEKTQNLRMKRKSVSIMSNPFWEITFR